MRFKISLMGQSSYFPSDFDDVLASIMHEKLSFISENYFNNFRYYNFSYFKFDNFYSCDDGSYYSRDGKVSFTLSSVKCSFLRYFIAYLMFYGIKYAKNHLHVVEVILLHDPDFSKENTFITISPIQIKEDENLSDYLKRQLIGNYIDCYEKNYYDSYLKLSAGQIFDKYSSGNDLSNFYIMEVIMEGDEDLIKFAWNTGLGESTYKGFGMLDVKQY